MITGSEPLSPDWVITGAPHGAGVRVVASKEMKPGGAVEVVEKTGVALVSRTSYTATYEPDGWKITVLAENVIVVDGPDYPTALRMLMSVWSVPDAPTPVRSMLAEHSSYQDEWHARG